MSQQQCEGRVALVTGASKGGTGTAIALRLAAEGARVAITARSVDGLEATQARIREAGGQCVVLPSDLSEACPASSPARSRASPVAAGPTPTPSAGSTAPGPECRRRSPRVSPGPAVGGGQAGG